MIKIENVTKKYGDNVILDNCSYQFPQNGIVCLLGASGGGKTTLLNLLAGFDTDYDGDIIVGDTPISHMSADVLCNYRKDNVGFIFQNYHLLSGFTALENVMLANELSQQQKDVSRQKARALLKQLGISEKENQNIETLSGGQKQRVAIARALINDPQILFADEPTGALDRATSTEIMELLQQISKDRLVIVITHDQKICDFAQEIIRIKDKTIVSDEKYTREPAQAKAIKASKAVKISSLPRAKKNFRVHIKRYIAISAAISVGVLAFLFSLSFGNVMDSSIGKFQDKNTAFNNGYIKGTDDGKIQKFLKGDDRIENVYYQYVLDKVELTFVDKTEIMPEKYPTPKAVEALSYGVMPRRDKNEIALSASLGKKLSSDIKELLNKELTLAVDGQTHRLTVSGIYNAAYDDFFVSSDVEQRLYDKFAGQDNYSISYDVKEFSDIVAVSNSLKLRGLSSKNASEEVYTLQKTFDSLNRLFFVVSILILSIALFICAVLLFKLQNTRYRELGLLSALGFVKGQISSMISAENFMLSGLATTVNLVLLTCSVVISKLVDFPFFVTGAQVVLSVVATFAIILLLSAAASYKLLRTEPAVALRK